MSAKSITAAVPRARLDASLASAPAHLRPILLAVRDGGCAWLTIPQGRDPFDVPTGKPVIAVVGDDMDETWGPSGLPRPSLQRLLRSCRAVSVVSCEPSALAYAVPVATAVGLRRNVAIVETGPLQEAAWIKLIQRIAPKASLVIATVKPLGGVH